MQEALLSFYNKYIKTKLLTPTSYSLSLKGKNTQTITINGYWENKDGIRLVEGTYEVTGTSAPKRTTAYVDSLAISFKENISINKETKSITLTAINSSYMLIFDASNIKSIQYTEYWNSSINTTYNLKKLNEIFYLFISQDAVLNNNIVITRNNNKETTIYLSGLPFERGKYYYFNDITNSFDIPPMTEGN